MLAMENVCVVSHSGTILKDLAIIHQIYKSPWPVLPTRYYQSLRNRSAGEETFWNFSHLDNWWRPSLPWWYSRRDTRGAPTCHYPHTAPPRTTKKRGVPHDPRGQFCFTFSYFSSFFFPCVHNRYLLFFLHFTSTFFFLFFLFFPFLFILLSFFPSFFHRLISFLPFLLFLCRSIISCGCLSVNLFVCLLIWFSVFNLFVCINLPAC